MTRRTAAEVQAEWVKVGDAIVALDLAVGHRPWDVSISDAAWRNPHPKGTSAHAALEEVHEEALRLEHRLAKLRAELERAESRQAPRRSIA